MDLSLSIKRKENLVLTRPDISSEAKQNLEAWIRKNKITNSLIINSSGTSTLTQKFYVIKHQSMLDHAEEILRIFDLNSSCEYINVLPDYFMGGISIDYRSLVGGFKVHRLESYKQIKDLVNNLECDRLLTSLIPYQAYDLAEKDAINWDKFKLIFIGGGATTDSLKHIMKDEFRSFYTTYGSTEFCSQLATSRITSQEKGIEILPFVSMRSHENEIRIKSPFHFEYMLHFHQGKIIKTEAYKDNLDFMSYWRSNDEGVVRKNHLYLSGRKGRVIKYRGRLVNLDELEDKLLQNYNLHQNKFFVGVKEDELKGHTPCLITQENLEHQAIKNLAQQGITEIYKTDEIKFTHSFKVIRQLEEYELKKLA